MDDNSNDQEAPMWFIGAFTAFAIFCGGSSAFNKYVSPETKEVLSDAFSSAHHLLIEGVQASTPTDVIVPNSSNPQTGMSHQPD